MASNGGLSAAASLVEVAVRAAVLAGAPRRTVAATAAAVASVALADLQRGAGASDGGSASVSRSKRRRIKRKKQAAKEKLAAPIAVPQSNDGGTDVGVDVGEASALTHVSANAASGLSTTVEQPPTLTVTADALPRKSCLHCGQEFDSRKKLFKHLEETGHGKLVVVGGGGTVSNSSFSVSSSDRVHSSTTMDVTPSSPAGGSASFSSVAQSFGPQPAKLKTGRGI